MYMTCNFNNTQYLNKRLAHTSWYFAQSIISISIRIRKPNFWLVIVTIGKNLDSQKSEHLKTMKLTGRSNTNDEFWFDQAWRLLDLHNVTSYSLLQRNGIQEFKTHSFPFTY